MFVKLAQEMPILRILFFFFFFFLLYSAMEFMTEKQFLCIDKYHSVIIISVKTSSLSALKCIVWHIILIGVAVFGRPYSDIELLTKILSRPHCRSYVPHTLIIKRYQDCRPSIWIHLQQFQHKCFSTICLDVLE